MPRSLTLAKPQFFIDVLALASLPFMPLMRQFCYDQGTVINSGDHSSSNAFVVEAYPCRQREALLAWAGPSWREVAGRRAVIAQMLGL